ncbi:MAG: TonB-dependent receptor [Pseudomonadaceae bacterium]|nr:TonB-dependent receptor [Pseudomonadaceae bacterium]
MRVPFVLKFGAIVVSLVASSFAVAAQPDNYVIEEIVVTAQKREQSIQDVPIAVSAFDSAFLDDAGVDDVLELQFFVPGLTIYNNQSATQTNFNIRGVGTAGNSLSLESSVGIYVDGVYRSRQSSAINDLIDVERVEVLKGPQGTLFGKNTASGAVQFLTVAPQLDEFGGYAEFNGGSESYANFNGAINIPFADGRAAARLSGGVTERDGWVDNIASGNDLNDKDRYSLRGQLLFLPTDDITVRLIADYSEIDEKCCSAANVFDGPGDTLAAFLAAGGGAQLPGVSYTQPIELLGADLILANRFDDDVAAMDIDPSAQIEESGFSAEVEWDIGNVTLTSVTAYRSYEATNFVDADFTSLDTLSASGGTAEQDTFTQEFRIAGDFGDSITYVAGMYYFDQDLDNLTILRVGADANDLLAGGLTTGDLVGGAAGCAAFGITAICDDPAFPENGQSDNISSQDQTSWAVFAQADFNLTEDLIATVGLRYLDEEKDMDVIFTESLFSPVWAAFTPLSPFVPDVNGAKFEDEEVTGTAKLTYYWNDDLMTYVSYGRGYKSGGTNIDRIDPALTGSPLLFDPETSDSYEIGMKADFLDKRLRVNAAAYLTDFKDFQANTFVGTGFVLQNAGEIQTRGFEVEVFALPAEWLTLQSGLAYVDAEYESFEGGACTRTPYGNEPDAGDPGFPIVCDNSGNTVGGTPEWTVYVSGQVSQRLADGNLFYGQLDVNWKDENPSGNDNDPNKLADSYTLTNLRVGYRFSGDRYDVSLWAKNLFDEDYTNGAFNSVIREGSLTEYHTEPQTWGVTLRATM